MKIPNIQRGVIVRRMLLSIVRLCHQRGQPLPRHDAIGAVIGIDDSQVSRHLSRLRAEGAFAVSRAGRRFYIQEIRP